MSSGEQSAADGKRIREEKRRKWLAKQVKHNSLQPRTAIHALNWVEQNSRFASLITKEDVQNIIDKKRGDLPLEQLLKPYFNLKESRPESRLAAGPTLEKQLFVAEGTETVRLLLQQSRRAKDTRLLPIHVLSILVKPSVLLDGPVELVTDVQPTTTHLPPFHVLVAEESVQSLIAGFPISRGALACGVVPQYNLEWLLEYVQYQTKTNQRLRLLALDGICDTANLGSMIRCASAFGIDAILLSRDCCDAWYRRSIRVSMGHIFRVPSVRVENLADTLASLAGEQFGVISYAAVVDSRADLILDEMEKGNVASRWCCILGNEANGISDNVRTLCSHTIRISMDDEVDSLSVPIAAGILLNGLKEREPNPS